MAKKKGKRQDVVFRRVRGRIVPIRRKANYDTEKKAALGGAGATVGGSFVMGAQIAAEKDVDVDAFKKKYADEIKKSKVRFEKAGVPSAQFQAYNVDPEKVRSRARKIDLRHQRELKRGRMKPFQALKKGIRYGLGIKSKSIKADRVVKYNPAFKKESILLHELGHARSSKRKYSVNKYLFGSKKYGVGKRLAKPFLNLGSELEASAESVRMATKKSGGKAGLKQAARMVAPYSTYVGGALVIGAGYSALYKYATTRKKKK